MKRFPRVLTGVAAAPLTAASAVTLSLILHGCGGNNTYNPDLRARPGVSPTPTVSPSPTPSGSPTPTPGPTPTPTPDPNEDVTIAVNPPQSSTTPGGSLTFTATVLGTENTAVTWSVEGGDANGTITQQGVYTAPATPGAYTIIATSQANPNTRASATISVTAGSTDGCVPGPVTGPGGLTASAFPKAGGDARNTGRSPGSGATGTLRWSAKTPNEGGFQIVIGPDGTLYHTSYPPVDGSTGGRVYALNPADGSIRWTFTAESGIVTVPAVGRNGLIYVCAATRNYAIDAQTGTIRWQSSPFEGRSLNKSPALGADGTLYISGNSLAAYDGETGAFKWSARGVRNGVTGWYVTSPAIGADGTLYVGGGDFKLHAVDGKCGTDRWAIDVGQVGGAAVGDDGTVYVTLLPFRNSNLTPNQVIAVDPANGAIKWTATDVPGEFSPPAIGPDGTIYVLGAAAELTALDPATGAKKWTYQSSTRGNNRSSPSVGGDGTVYFVQSEGGGGRLIAVDPVTGLLRWEYRITQAFGLADGRPSIAADGTVYVRAFRDIDDSANTGTVYAIR
jgi:outer membrane protein assembly factor BamB